MFLRGLVVAASGFLFIFSPGLPMGLLVRRSPPFSRDLIYWGIGTWLVALLPSLFIQSLLRQILRPGQAPRSLSGPLADYGLPLVGALLTAFFVAGAMYLLLRLKRTPPADLLPSGLALGFGVGLVAQVFTGLSLVGAGFRLIYGETSTAILSDLGQISFLNLMLTLLPLLIFRPALLTVSAARGVLVAWARQGRRCFFWLAVLVDAMFTWAILALQLALGNKNAGQVLVGAVNPSTAVVTMAYYALAFGLAYGWLLAQLAGWGSDQVKGKGRGDARH